MKNTRIKNAIDKENTVIGNLKNQFEKTTLRAQRFVRISPSEVSGNIALSYHRGLAQGREEGIKTAISMLKVKYPEANKYLRDWYKNTTNK